MIDREMFEEWLAHPVTEHVLKRVGELAELNKQKWIDQSWGAGRCEPMVLIELKARAQAAKDLSTIEWSDIDDESERNKSNGIQGTNPAD
jgi:hypothetical protein